MSYSVLFQMKTRTDSVLEKVWGKQLPLIKDDEELHELVKDLKITASLAAPLLGQGQVQQRFVVPSDMIQSVIQACTEYNGDLTTLVDGNLFSWSEYGSHIVHEVKRFENGCVYNIPNQPNKLLVITEETITILQLDQQDNYQITKVVRLPHKIDFKRVCVVDVLSGFVVYSITDDTKHTILIDNKRLIFHEEPFVTGTQQLVFGKNSKYILYKKDNALYYADLENTKPFLVKTNAPLKFAVEYDMVFTVSKSGVLRGLKFENEEFTKMFKVFISKEKCIDIHIGRWSITVVFESSIVVIDAFTGKHQWKLSLPNCKITHSFIHRAMFDPLAVLDNFTPKNELKIVNDALYVPQLWLFEASKGILWITEQGNGQWQYKVVEIVQENISSDIPINVKINDKE